MSPAGGYPIEEFLEAITAQLDQTQDALRLKAVNRPLTFALKDFNVDLKVFVEMDQGGRVTFRPAAPNEEGASTVSIGFTTITRPMIEENTISMEMASAPTLDELGLDSSERRQLERVGVRNAAQLRNLEANASDEGLARHTGVNLGRIRGALNLARPRLNDIVDPDHGVPTDGLPTEPPQATPMPPDVRPEPRPEPRPELRPELRPGPRPTFDPAPGQTPPLIDPEPTAPRPREDGAAPRQGPSISLPGRSPFERLNIQPTPQPAPNEAAPTFRGSLAPRRKLDVGPAARKIDLRGNNLIDAGKLPVARLDGQKLNLLAARPSAVSFALPDGWALGPGRLSVEMPDGAMENFDLSGGAGS